MRPRSHKLSGRLPPRVGQELRRIFGRITNHAEYAACFCEVPRSQQALRNIDRQDPRSICTRAGPKVEGRLRDDGSRRKRHTLESRRGRTVWRVSLISGSGSPSDRIQDYAHFALDLQVTQGQATLSHLTVLTSSRRATTHYRTSAVRSSGVCAPRRDKLEQAYQAHQAHSRILAQSAQQARLHDRKYTKDNCKMSANQSQIGLCRRMIPPGRAAIL